MVEKNYIKVICPWCGKEMDLLYIYDGTYETCHSYGYYKDGTWEYGGCKKNFYVAILNGMLHVYRRKEDLEEILKIIGSKR